ncbi:hypothetical protein SAMN05421780_11033 [Flexibacter flexilis DSM 6793]|uniref:Uncharacterized protein n=1 Tax=Flexibacter flexilis DSM 6793 TaxID=927664 RepID=A0A1I1M4Y6_9BACT|nr:hypothetical protein [Flexibacter flexilis]SFC80451.1 hypothetical protein SAMN05421780_11033 [Flexibacter flexilis DSM 6793]
MTTNSDKKLFVFDSVNYTSESAAYADACAKELIFANRVGCPYQFGYAPVCEKYNTTPKIYYVDMTVLWNEDKTMFDEQDRSELITLTEAQYNTWLDWTTGLPTASVAQPDNLM